MWLLSLSHVLCTGCYFSCLLTWVLPALLCCCDSTRSELNPCSGLHPCDLCKRSVWSETSLCVFLVMNMWSIMFLLWRKRQGIHSFFIRLDWCVPSKIVIATCLVWKADVLGLVKVRIRGKEAVWCYGRVESCILCTIFLDYIPQNIVKNIDIYLTKSCTKNSRL